MGTITLRIKLLADVPGLGLRDDEVRADPATAAQLVEADGTALYIDRPES